MTATTTSGAPALLAQLRRSGWTILWLTLVWQAMWRDLSWGNLIGGVIAAAGVTLLFPLPEPTSGIRLKPFAMARFLGVFTWSVLKANVIVAWEVLTPQNRIREGIIGVPLRCDHPVVVTTINHAVNLAPGTMVIDIDMDPCVVYVHVLHLEDPDDVHAEVHQLEELVMAAFGLSPEEAP
ncbi:MAG: Na+/H+ antiporter subunit E [Actinomycetota bacterium]